MAQNQINSTLFNYMYFTNLRNCIFFKRLDHFKILVGLTCVKSI